MSNSKLLMRLLLLLFLASAGCAWNPVDSVVILHTGDLHDHLRADYDGTGGMAYVSGYLRSVQKNRPDTLVVDTGDVMEKGDLLGFVSRSTLMYEGMARAGYDVAVPGNHDDAYGYEHLHYCDSLAPEMTLLANNLFKDDGSLEFSSSKIYDVDGVRVGVIGAARPRDTNSLTLEETGQAVAREAARLEKDSDLIVVLAHMGTGDCTLISQMAPEVDLFIGGHTHAALKTPVKVEETGAFIVQAGSQAEFVGRVELKVNTDTDEILELTSELVEMRHDVVPVDEEFRDRIREQEKALAPDADTVIGELSSVLNYLDLGIIGAEAYRRAAGTDIGFCHAGQVIRDTLGPGLFDVNAVFRTGGQRGYAVVKGQMTGRQIETYLNGLANRTWGQTIWSGFNARTVESGEHKTVVTDLESARTYSFVMPELEWRTRLTRLWEQLESEGQSVPSRPTAAATEIHFTESVAEYFNGLERQGVELDQAAHVARPSRP